jgi:polar amino acid transport system permease protein
VFRGLPPLVQLLIWYNLAYLVPQIRIGLPFFGPELASFDTNVVISAWTAAVIALSLHEGAYMAETIRAGLLSVDPGQRDAAKALGMSERRTLFRIVLPQALRFIIPPTGSQAIALLKGTSLVSAITLGDLLHSVQLIYDRTFQVVPMLVVACFWYLLVIAILSFFQMKLERYYGRGHRTLAVPS